jgi:hypothetical protein
MLLQEKCDELARASKEKGDTSGAEVSARGSSILLNQISASSGGLIVYGDESDTTIPNLNTVSVYIYMFASVKCNHRLCLHDIWKIICTPIKH